MKLLSLTSAAVVAALTSSPSVDAFTLSRVGGFGRAAATTRTSPSSPALHALNLPRLDLPDAVSDKLKDLDLKSPNEMSEAEYKGYSGAAILGTLLFFSLPGAVLTGVPEDLGGVAGAALSDFAVSALTGGGLAIYLALRAGQVGSFVREYGNRFLDAVPALPRVRYDLPSQVTDVMGEKLGLLNPNEMDEDNYNGYSGAAIVGTLLFFLLPGAQVSGEFEYLGDLGGALVTDFVFAALIGGGLAIYLSLRDDAIGDSVNQAGYSLLETVDGLIDGSNLLPAAASATVVNGATAATVADESAGEKVDQAAAIAAAE